MKINVEVNGETHQIDTDVAALTLQDTRAIKKQLGAETYRDTFGKGLLQDPDAMAAIIWCQLRHDFPGLSIDDIDIPLADMFGAEDDDPNPPTGN